MARRTVKTADENAEAVTAENNAAESAGSASEEKKFPLSRLATHCRRLFGVSSSAFAGATANLTRESYSKSEVAAVIEEWKKKEAK